MVKNLLALIFVLCTLGLVYAANTYNTWENNLISKKGTQLLTYDKVAPNSQTDGGWDDTHCKGKELCLVSPKAGDKLCLGKALDIQWNAPEDMELVNIWIRGLDGSDARGIATVHAISQNYKEKGRGHYLWKVEKVLTATGSQTLTKGKYTMNIWGRYGNQFIDDQDDTRVFTVDSCST